MKKITILRPSMFAVLGCQHEWTFPIRTPAAKLGKLYPAGFDSHQCCTVCGRKRFYSFQTMEVGPEFCEVEVRS